MTKAIKKGFLGTLLTLLLMMVPTTILKADMSGFAAGISIEGYHYKTTGSSRIHTTNADTKGSVNEEFAIPSVWGQYTFSINDRLGLQVGLAFVPEEGTFISESRADTDLEEGTTTSGTKSAVATIRNHMTLYIQPTIWLTENQAVYLSAGVMHANMEMDAKLVTSTNFKRSIDVVGARAGVGVMSLINDGWFVKLEGHVSEYDQIAWNTSDGSSAKGDPEAYSVALQIGRSF